MASQMTWSDSTGGRGSAKIFNEHNTYIIQFSNNGEWVERRQFIAATGCPLDLAHSYDETPSHATVSAQQSGCSITAQITETSSAPAHTLWGTVTDDGYPSLMTWSDSTGGSGSAKIFNEHSTYIIQFSNNGEWVQSRQFIAATGCPSDLAHNYDETPSHATVSVQQSGCSITAQIAETSSAPAHTLWGTVTDNGYPSQMTWSDSTVGSGSAKIFNEHSTYII